MVKELTGVAGIELSAKLEMVKMKEILESIDKGVVFARGALLTIVGSGVVEG